MKNIAVVIRVFSRVEDTKCLVEVIKKKWTQNNYSIFVSFNGAPAGFSLDQYVYDNSEVVEITDNKGHLLGAESLIQAGYEHIRTRTDFEYVILVDSDFWLLDEALIINALKQEKDLATTIYFESRQTLGVDFFMMKKEVLDRHSEILNWNGYPERHLKNYALKEKLSVYILQDLRSTHASKLMKKFSPKIFKDTYNTFIQGGRFRLFSKAKAVTHHIEDLQGGVEAKKLLANSVAGEEIFSGVGKRELSFLEKNAPYISLYIPQGSWLRKKIWK